MVKNPIPIRVEKSVYQRYRVYAVLADVGVGDLIELSLHVLERELADVREKSGVDKTAIEIDGYLLKLLLAKDRGEMSKADVFQEISELKADGEDASILSDDAAQSLIDQDEALKKKKDEK